MSAGDPLMALQPGLEPRQTAPEAVVLPLYYRRIGRFILVPWEVNFTGAGCNKNLHPSSGTSMLPSKQSPYCSPPDTIIVYVQCSTKKTQELYVHSGRLNREEWSCV